MRLIDADDLKEHYNVPDAEGVYSYCDTIMQVIESQPTIVPEVRHGRWEYRHADDWMFCTACGTDAEGNYGEPLETDFCPHCGADMREGGADNG